MPFLLILAGPEGRSSRARHAKVISQDLTLPSLSFMVEVFSGILTGLGFGHDPAGPHNDGCFVLAMQVGAFFPLDEFKRQVEAFVRYLKDSPPASGFTEVLYPGELEYRTEQQRRQEGIVVEEQTWEALQRLAQEYRITVTPHS